MNIRIRIEFSHISEREEMHTFKYTRTAFQSNILEFGWSGELPLTSLMVGRLSSVCMFFKNVPLVEEAQNKFHFFL